MSSEIQWPCFFGCVLVIKRISGRFWLEHWSSVAESGSRRFNYFLPKLWRRGCLCSCAFLMIWLRLTTNYTLKEHKSKNQVSTGWALEHSRGNVFPCQFVSSHQPVTTQNVAQISSAFFSCASYIINERGAFPQMLWFFIFCLKHIYHWTSWCGILNILVVNKLQRFQQAIFNW